MPEFEEVRIPRVKLWHEEYYIFMSLERFTEYCHELSWAEPGKTGNNAAPISALRQMLNTTRIPVPEIQELFYMLRDAAFEYVEPTDKPSEKPVRDIFAASKFNKLEKQITRLKKLVGKHTTYLVDLMDYQEGCKKSRDGLKMYSSMLKAAEFTLPLYDDDEHEYKVRKFAIKCLKKDVADWQRIHVRRSFLYNTVREWLEASAVVLRENSASLSEEVQSYIKRRLNSAVQKLRNTSKPTVFEGKTFDADAITKGIYNFATKVYRFPIPPTEIDSEAFDEKIIRPRLEKSAFDAFRDQVFPSFGAGCHIRATVIIATPYPQYFLDLKVGDKVMIRMLSMDTSMGFGYKKCSMYKFKWKRWGFFYTSSLLLLTSSFPGTRAAPRLPNSVIRETNGNTTSDVLPFA